MKHDNISWTNSVKENNQDAYGLGPTVACVVDGATPLSDNPDAPRLTAVFAQELATSIGEHVTSPQDIVSQIAEALSSAQQSVHRIGAQATLSVVSWDNDSVTVAVVGDSPIFVRINSGEVIQVVDPMYENRSSDALEAVRDLIDSGVSPSESYAIVLKRLGSDRHLRNQPGQCWIATDQVNPQDLAENMHIVSFPRSEVLGVSLATDGLVGLSELEVDLLDNLLWNSDVEGLDLTFDTAIVVQDKDSDKTEYPRISNKDDATLVRISLD